MSKASQYQPLIQSGLLCGVYGFLLSMSLAAIGLWPGFTYLLALSLSCLLALAGSGLLWGSAKIIALPSVHPAIFWMLFANALLLIGLLWGEPQLISTGQEHAH